MSIKNLLRRTKAASQAAEGLPDGAMRMLVATLAKLDALFYPWRYHDDFMGEVTMLWQQHYKGKYAIAARGSGLAQWKSASDERAQLTRAGLAKSITKAQQVIGLVLTLDGQSLARALVGLPDSIDVGVRLLTDQTAKWRNGWCSESALFGVELIGNPQQWDVLTELMVPALVAGVVTANNDSDGRVYYWLNSSVNYVEPEPCKRPAESWAVEHYFDAYIQERRALTTLENVSHNLTIPMPRGGW